MESRVVGIASRRVPLSGGDWILVKDRLNAGEHRQMAKRGSTDGGVHIDLFEAGVAKVLAFLLDWSMVDPQGAVIPIARQTPEVVVAALNSIGPEDYTEILRAIEAHERAMQAERDAQKKIPPGASTSSPLSPSPAPADSPTTGPTS